MNPGRTIRHCLFLFLYLLASCTGSGGAGQARNPFIAHTPEGVVLVKVNGTATGTTDEELTRLIRRGVAQIYPVLSNTSPGVSLDAPQLVWDVIKDGRTPTAVVTVKVVRDGRVVRSEFAHVSAPGANPDAVFIHDISALAYRVLPPATNVAGKNTSDRS